MGEGNQRLRRRRLAAASALAPGEPMGRHELAELVNDVVLHRTGRPGALDANYIGKLERGLITWPRDHHRAGFREVLGATTDRELGFVRASESHSERSSFARSAVTAGLVPVSPVSSSSWVLPVEWTPREPARVEQQHVDRVTSAARLFTAADHGAGGMDVAAVAGVQLGQAARLIPLPCPAALRPELFTAVGWLSNVVAFAQFDAARHAQAAHAFAFALECAERAANWHLRAKTLSGLARDAIWRGDPDAGLTYVELALVRADRLTCTERAMLLTARARALAQLGRVQETITSVRAADEQFSGQGRDAEANPPWMAYYDRAQHLGDTGHALYDLVAHGHPADEAMRRLRGAVASHGPSFVRSRGMSAAKLATLAIAAGDQDQAASVAAGSLDLLGDAHSLRARRLVVELAEAADAQPSSTTGEVRERIHHLLSRR